MKRVLAVLVACALGFALSTNVHAATIASDNASDTVYNDAWTTGDNGGTGFGAWTLASQGVNSGHYIGDSRTLNDAGTGADINVSSESFAMYGHTSQESSAIRSFTGDLSVGQTFSIELAVNYRNGFKGLDLRDSSGGTIINFNVTGDDYQMGGSSIGNTYSDNTEFLLQFAQTSAGGGTWTITRSGGVSDLDSGTYTGLANGFKLYNSSTSGGDNENNLFANSMQIAPTTTSSGVDLRAYKAVEGVYVEFVAYDVEADGSIQLALLNEESEPVWTGEVDVEAGPQFTARFLVPGLELGGTYDFLVRDEVGKWWDVDGVTVGEFKAKMVSATLAGITLSFDTLPERSYEIQWTPSLGKPWQQVDEVTATGEKTRVVVPHPDPEHASGFFRFVLK